MPILHKRLILPALVLGSVVASAQDPEATEGEWSRTLGRDERVEGVTLPVGSRLVFRPGPSLPALRLPDGRNQSLHGPPAPVLARVVPSRELIAWGLPVASGEDFYPGTFVSLVLAHDATARQLPVEAGSIVEFERRRGAGEDAPEAIKVLRSCTLAKAANVEGVVLPGRTAIEFSPEGDLWRARLFDDDEVEGLPLSSDADIEFEEGGKMVRFRLSEPFDFDGHHCEPGDVRRFPSGRLQSCTLSSTELVHGMQADPSRPVTFHDSGAPESLVLAKSVFLEGEELVSGTFVRLSAAGRVRRLQAPRSTDGAAPVQVVRGIPLVPLPGRVEDGAFFRSDGSLEKVVTAVDFEFDGIPIHGGPEPVDFWPSGRLRSARLSRDLPARGHRYPAGTRLKFKRDGSLGGP
jgi:hypothetical protein